MDQTTVIIVHIASWALSLFAAWSFFKAAKFKATARKETMLAAGFGWIKNLPLGVVRLVAYIEFAGVVGIILAPAADQFLGWSWAAIWGVLAAAGLALTMLVAAIMHIVRGEFKYTWKGNVTLFAASAGAAVLLALPLLAV